MPFDAATGTTASDILLLAERSIARPWRWRKGRAYSLWPWERRCLTGALVKAELNLATGALSRSEEDLAERALELAVKARGFESSVLFNDHPGTTHRQVLQVLREAAELASATGARHVEARR